MVKVKKKYYAVARGVKPGIYHKWFGADGAEIQVRGFQGARYKGFLSLKEAEEWLRNPQLNYSSSKSAKKEFIQNVHKSEADVVIYTDGSALNNPGPGGYGVVIKNNGKPRQELSGGYQRTTNNRMELMACIVGLRELKDKTSITLYSDSKYVVNGITKGWARSWRSRGWIKSDGKKAMNSDLWSQLLAMVEFHDVDFRWVKGHAGNPGNERCDVLANKEAGKSDQPIDTGYE